MNLAGRKVLVTGGAARIGRTICIAFAKAGAKVAVHYNHSRTEALELLEMLGGINAGHIAVHQDFSDPETAGDLLSAVGDADILVNNASVYLPSDGRTEDRSAARNQLDINFRSPLALMEGFHARKRTGGCIINILDRNIFKANPVAGSYLQSKKALADATLSAAIRWAPVTRVNAVAPGAVLPPKSMPGSKMEKQIAMTPMKRAPTPEEVADACIFLAMNESVTGQIIFVDGGQHL